MPPQPGVFALPYSSAGKSRGQNGIIEAVEYHPSNLNAGPSRTHGAVSLAQSVVCEGSNWPTCALYSGLTPVDDPQKRKRKEFASKLGKEMSDRREE